MHDPEMLTPGTRVRLPGDVGAVTLISVTAGAFWDLVYRSSDGQLGSVTLPEDELPDIEVLGSESAIPFDASPAAFQLGVEARRIRLGFQHDMAALAVSNITPLPHQLEAVYEHFLPQARLRFLLADDPGAGKTIMAGLYMKELQLRRAADRILIVTPANLRPQWQRELTERFQIDAVQFDRAVFDASPTANPWDVHDVVIVSRDFLKSEEALEAFVQAEKDWDLAILDEVHGYTLQVDGRGFISKKSQRYKAAERIADKAQRLILLTATPHSGRNESLWGLLRLLDRDAYGDRMVGNVNLHPRYYSRTSKEQMVDLRGEPLFKPRYPHTVDYRLAGAELDLYEAVTDFVGRQLAEIKGDAASSAAGFALTTMQRRLASSVRAIRRTLERRVDRLEKALEDPAAWLRTRRTFKASLVPDADDPDSTLADLDEQALWDLEERALAEWLPQTEVELRAEVEALRPLLAQAQQTEQAGVERKLNELMEVVNAQGLREDASKKLLIFTEHKDTLDYLVEKLSAEFDVVMIHGGLKLADRIAAERAFRERAQIMVATEAAGEGINLQFCHLMVNYDIPWNPNRLEQRMGRIHRIGQTQDVHIFNLVAGNTREGQVLTTLLKKLEKMGTTLGDQVFDVIGEVFAGLRLKDILEEVIAGTMTTAEAQSIFGTDPEEFDPAIVETANRLLTDALATDHLDWQAERARADRAAERRLPPEYLERFFIDAIEFLGGRVEHRLDHTLRVSRTPDVLVARSRVGNATRRVAPEYARVTFSRDLALRQGVGDDKHLPAPELCGPGHPLFDGLVDVIVERTVDTLAAGTHFHDPDATTTSVLHVMVGDVVDGNHELVHQSLATVSETAAGYSTSRRYLYDLLPADAPPENTPSVAETTRLVGWAREHIFEQRYQQAKEERLQVADVQEQFLNKAFQALLARHDQQLFDLDDAVEAGDQGADGRRRQAELAKAQTREKRDRRLAEVQAGRSVRRGSVRVIASCIVSPTQTAQDEPDVDGDGSGLSNDQVEHIAVQVAWDHEEQAGASHIQSVEADNVGFDVLSLRGIDRRCIEVKGRAGVGGVKLTWSEFAKAVELGEDYWLYVVLDCATGNPRLYRVQNPAKNLMFKPEMDVRFGIDPATVIDASETDLA